ncbi:MAG: UDP-4-amino-4,6-dideoxy-N-acetyl-beta-L-altrosamine transaminase [Halobacteriovorax sp.]|nr:UDP-4-amino-4,6-dideoxy-N-acetyl-beta-L-altrosamine transaminase [Halobacteriovorax sp.]|tara:strand:- start:8460 stop:9671 length:1212 start_codon:yes stop_codon:yes gene_type:complete
MKEEFLPYSKPVFCEKEVEAVSESLRSGWLSMSKKVAEFEEDLASKCKVKHALFTSSGTTALHLALAAIDFKEGDYLVTTPMTFVASANAARYCGGDVLFADTLEEYPNIDSKSVENKLLENSNVKCIMPVHFGGLSCDMQELNKLKEKFKVRIVEDASHALGASYITKDGKEFPVGSCEFSDMTIFSLHPVKNITTGEGGVITTNDTELYKKLVLLRNHSMQRDSEQWENKELAFDANGNVNSWYYEVHQVGFNFRPTEFQGALASAQLQKLDGFIDERRKLASKYTEIFRSQFDENVIKTLDKEEYHGSAYHLFPILIDFEKLSIDRNELMKRLSSNGVGTQVHYIPVHLQPYYSKRYSYKMGDFPNAEKYYSQCLSIPIYPGMREQDMDRVIETLRGAIG